MAPHPQLPVCIFTKLTTKRVHRQPRVLLQVCLAWTLLLADERKSDHDEVGWGTAPPCADPTDSRARSVFGAKLDRKKWREGPVPAMRAHARRAVLPFRLDLWAMESIASCRRSRRGGMRGVHACRDAGDYVCLGACWM